MRWTEQANLLLRKAHEDATALTKMAADREITDAIAGFHAQQAVEKALKSVLAARGIPFPRTHDLELLHDLLVTSGVQTPQAIDDALILSPFAVLFRYDDPPQGSLDRADAVRLVTAVLAWCDSQVASAS